MGRERGRVRERDVKLNWTLGNRIEYGNCPPPLYSPERDGLTLLARLQAPLLAHLQRVGVFGAEGLLKWQHCLQCDALEAVCNGSGCKCKEKFAI